MKKEFIPFMLCLLVTGCSSEENVPEVGFSVNALIESDVTRTAVTDEGAFTWTEGDRIWISSGKGTGHVEGTLTSGAGTSSAIFSYGSVIGGLTCAIYPEVGDHSLDDSDNPSFCALDTYELGAGLNETNAWMYGEYEGGSFKFKHLAGIIRFSFEGVPAGTDSFRFKVDKGINGMLPVTDSENGPVVQAYVTEDEAMMTRTLTFDALEETSDIELYVPVPIGTYNSLDLALFAGDEAVWTYSNAVRNTVNSKSLLLMPTVIVAGSVGGDIEDAEPSAKEGDYVDEYGINHGQGIEFNGVVWAPVNCGYHAMDYRYGKLYQWGRKDGQGRDTDAVKPEINKEWTYDSMSENVFYTHPWSGLADAERVTLWNKGTEEVPVKTQYDPCPEGWRIPTLAEMAVLRVQWIFRSTDDKGCVGALSLYGNMFLPTGGYRDNSGTFVSDKSVYWCSKLSPISTSSAYHAELSTDFSFHDEFYVECGCSVRCVRE